MDPTEPLKERIDVAYHEASHSIVQYRVSGHADARTTCLPRPDDGVLGVSEDPWSDSSNEADMRARILSCYAGGHCDRKRGCFDEVGCSQDEEEAARLLREWDWESQEAALREESRQLIERHWAEIAAVAAELARVGTLDQIEVQTIADMVAGTDPDATPESLKLYRALRSSSPDLIERPPSGDDEAGNNDAWRRQADADQKKGEAR
jgi:hypothetical protein